MSNGVSRGMYLWGKEMGLESAEFYLRHVHPSRNEAEKDLLRAAAEEIRNRRLVAQAERKALLDKAKQEVEQESAQ